MKNIKHKHNYSILSYESLGYNSTYIIFDIIMNTKVQVLFHACIRCNNLQSMIPLGDKQENQDPRL